MLGKFGSVISSLRREVFLVALLALGLLLLVLPVPYLRLHDDEALYYSWSRETLEGVAPLHGRGILPFLLVAPALAVWDHLFASRLVTASFTLGSVILIFVLARRLYGPEAGFASALLFLFSFGTLRFGSRFYLEPFGLFFFLLALYLLEVGRPFAGGVSAVLAVMGRDVWLVVFPFLLLYVWKRRASIRPFLGGSSVTALGGVFFVLAVGGVDSLAGASVLSSVPRHLAWLSGCGWGLLGGLSTALLEFGAVNFLLLAGLGATFLLGVYRGLWILIVPSLLALSLIGGFAVNGALTQYPLGLQGLMAVPAGFGVMHLWKKVAPKAAHRLGLMVVLGILVAQFAAFNQLASSLSPHGMEGVFDLGYGHDEAALAFLNSHALGGRVATATGHWAFLDGASEARWTERDVVYALSLNPDWYLTYESYVTLAPGQDGGSGLDVYSFGPYLVLGVESGQLGDYVYQREFPQWAFRDLDPC